MHTGHYSLQRLHGRLIGRHPVWVGTGLSGGTLDCLVTPSDHWRDDAADDNRVFDRWRRWSAVGHQ